MTKPPEKNLDILRAIAVLCVLANHIGNVLAPDSINTRAPGLSPWYMIGRAGVLIFFVHTSYVLMGSLDRIRAEGHRGWELARIFYVRRAFRIYPLAMVTVLLVVLLQLPSGPEPWSRVRDAGGLVGFTNLALIQNLAGTPNLLDVLWSLPIEVQMYLFLPLIFGWFRRSSIFGTLLFWGAAIALVPAMMSLGGESLFNHRLDLLLFGPCFVAGAAAYHLSVRLPASVPSRVWLPMLLSVLAGFALIPELRIQGSVGLPKLPWAWALTALIAAGLILVKDSAGSRLTSLGHTIAKYSYGIYLMHVVVLVLAMRISPHPRSAIWLAAALGGIAVAAWLGYRFVEAPGIGLGKRLTQSKPQRSRPAIVPQAIEAVPSRSA